MLRVFEGTPQCLQSRFGEKIIERERDLTLDGVGEVCVNEDRLHVGHDQ